MLKIKFSNQFKKDYKLIQKRGYDINKLKYVIQLLSEEKTLPVKYKEHYLTGNYRRIQRMSYWAWLAFNLYYKKRWTNLNYFKNRLSFRFILMIHYKIKGNLWRIKISKNDNKILTNEK